jgi:[acyl-carrier-protein] S-malonyltransferase
MGHELAGADESAAEIFRTADEVLGFPISQLMWEGPEAELNQTHNTQPALLIHSVAVLRAFQARFPGFRPRFAAGHSLGEFSALVAADSLGYPDALRLVRARGEAMRDAGESEPGGMAAVLGLDTEQVEAACAQARETVNGGVWVANDNCPGQVVISGDDTGLEAASPMLEEAGARKVVRLAVSIAAHSPYMRAAAERLSSAIAAADLRDPQVPVIGNVSAQPLRTAVEVRQDLQAQLTANVRWTESMSYLAQSGVEDFVELGSGSVLTGLMKRIDRDANRFNLDSPQSFSDLSG